MIARPPAKSAGAACLAAMRGSRLALAGWLLFVQALALIHLGTAAHLLDLRTGRIMHATGEPPHDVPAEPTPKDHPDGCAVYAVLTQSATTASPVSPLHLILPTRTGSALPAARPIHSFLRELHRLSPAHSPPATT